MSAINLHCYRKCMFAITFNDIVDVSPLSSSWNLNTRCHFGRFATLTQPQKTFCHQDVVRPWSTSTVSVGLLADGNESLQPGSFGKSQIRGADAGPSAVGLVCGAAAQPVCPALITIEL